MTIQSLTPDDLKFLRAVGIDPDDAQLEFAGDPPQEPPAAGQWGKQTPRQVLQTFFDEDR